MMTVICLLKASLRRMSHYSNTTARQADVCRRGRRRINAIRPIDDTRKAVCRTDPTGSTRRQQSEPRLGGDEEMCQNRTMNRVKYCIHRRTRVLLNPMWKYIRVTTLCNAYGNLQGGDLPHPQDGPAVLELMLF